MVGVVGRVGAKSPARFGHRIRVPGQALGLESPGSDIWFTLNLRLNAAPDLAASSLSLETVTTKPVAGEPRAVVAGESPGTGSAAPDIGQRTALDVEGADAGATRLLELERDCAAD
ncbi:hypothetical protein BTVI_108059 [Pitangus sulphuratus]|nr:hypothetical protein BTVI_108059 [Pitangus sulphuratus]